MFSANFDGLDVLRGNVAIKPNKGKPGMLSDGPNTMKDRKKEHWVWFSSLSRLR